ncbi:MAG: hypothetical protein ACYSWP_22635 [Planctomycetota bacterium]|jgi:hypothetical protein
MNTRITQWTVLVCILVVIQFAFADYDMSWNCIANNGGGKSTGGDYTIIGSLGQPNVSEIFGADYELFGDFFWPFFQAELPTETTIDIDPNTLDLNSRGRWLTCYIHLSSEYYVTDINPDTIRLEGTIQAGRTTFQPEDNIAKVKFERLQLQDLLLAMGVEDNDQVILTLTGELYDETAFAAADTITVLNKPPKKIK